MFWLLGHISLIHVYYYGSLPQCFNSRNLSIIKTAVQLQETVNCKELETVKKRGAKTMSGEIPTFKFQISWDISSDSFSWLKWKVVSCSQNGASFTCEIQISCSQVSKNITGCSVMVLSSTENPIKLICMLKKERWAEDHSCDHSSFGHDKTSPRLAIYTYKDNLTCLPTEQGGMDPEAGLLNCCRNSIRYSGH